MGQTVPAMQAMKLLASSGVMAAAGAMISLTFAVSPPLTLVPPRQVAVDVNDDVNDNVISHQTVGEASTDTSGGGTESTDDIPSISVQPREGSDGLSGDSPPVSQEASQVTPRRDPLEGL